MTTPKFSLQNVLDIRHDKVERLEIKLSNLLAACQKTEILLLSFKESQIFYMERLNTIQSGEIDLVEMNFLRSNILLLDERIRIVSLELARQKQDVEEKRTELIKAKQGEETLEILKKKRNEVYLEEQVQIEARIQDDIYIARAFRNRQLGV